MIQTNLKQKVDGDAPVLESGLEKQLLASGWVTEIRKSLGHNVFAVSDTGILAIVKAMQMSSIEDSLEKEQKSSNLFPESDDALFSKKEVMLGFNVSHTTLWKWEKNKYLVPVKIGRRVYYKRSDIEKLTK